VTVKCVTDIVRVEQRSERWIDLGLLMYKIKPRGVWRGFREYCRDGREGDA